MVFTTEPTATFLINLHRKGNTFARSYKMPVNIDRADCLQQM